MDGGGCAARTTGAGHWVKSLGARVVGQPLSRTALRQLMRVNNARLGPGLQTLQQQEIGVIQIRWIHALDTNLTRAIRGEINDRRAAIRVDRHVPEAPEQPYPSEVNHVFAEQVADRVSVLAGAEGEAVRARATQQDVVARAATSPVRLQLVDTNSAIEEIGSAPTIKVVRTGPAAKRVLLSALVQVVVARTSLKGILAGAATEIVVVRSTFKDVVAFSAIERVVCFAAVEMVVAGAALDPVIAAETMDVIVEKVVVAVPFDVDVVVTLGSFRSGGGSAAGRSVGIIGDNGSGAEQRVLSRVVGDAIGPFTVAG